MAAKYIFIAGLTFLITGSAYAQSGDTSGNATGSDVKPTQSTQDAPPATDKSGTVTASPDAAKTPGIKGPKGSENGPAPTPANR